MQSPQRQSSPKKGKRTTTTTTTTTEVKTSTTKTISNTVFNNLMAEQRANDDLKYEIQGDRNEIEQLKNTLLALNQKLEVFKDLENDVQMHKGMLKDSENHRNNLQAHIVDASRKIDEDTENHQTLQNSLINENKDLKNQIQELKKEMARQDQAHRDDKERMRQQYEAKINDQDIKIKNLSSTITKLESTILSLQQLLKKKEDVEEQLRMAREHVAQMDAAKQQLHQELLTAQQVIHELEQIVYTSKNTSLDLLKALKDSEYQVETLKQYVIDLKSRIAVYIPVKGDAIDKKLAEYINNYPDRQKLKIMFMRESEGVYQFGTKRVAVKVEKDKINIRVGGGYLSLDEFLDQYTPAELEKLERKDPLKRFSEKVAVQKTIVGKERMENSPVRNSRAKSPIKI